jgi:SAM-dependent methyltransferase
MERIAKWGNYDSPFVRRRYNRLARLFILFEWLFLLPRGIRGKAVSRLELKPGARVLEVGCGTGRNLARLVQAVGEQGNVYGVDLSEGMLQEARELSVKARWRNVTLIESDAIEYTLPELVDGVIFSLSYAVIPRHREALRRAWEHLRPRGRVVIMDAKLPSGFLRGLLHPFVTPPRSGMMPVMKKLFALGLLIIATPAWSQPVPGSLDVHWNEGAPDCTATPQDPLQVHTYEPQTFILRQSPCATFEANFLYLLVGSEKALLIDTGAVEDPKKMPLAKTILGLLPDKNDKKLPLLVAHTHRHLDHRAGDPQFASLPSVQTVPIDLEGVRTFSASLTGPTGLPTWIWATELWT